MQPKQNSEERQIIVLTRELIGGKPPNEIPLPLIPQLLLSLQSAKQKAIHEGQVTRVQLIQKATVSLEKYQKSRQLTKKTEKKILSMPPPPTAVLDSTIEDLVDGIPYDVAQTSMLPYLIERCKHIINTLLDQGKYAEAQKYENVHKTLVDLKPVRTAEERTQSKIRSLQDQLKSFKRQLQDAQNKYEFSLQSNIMERDQRLSLLNEEFEKQMRDFDLVTNGPLPPSSRKFSANLLNLRETEKFLLKSRRYDEDAAIKEEADAQEKNELIEMEEKFIFMRQKERMKLEEAHQQKLKCFNDKEQRKRIKIIQEHEKDIENLQKTIENIESRISIIESGGSENISTSNLNSNNNHISTFSARRPKTALTVQKGPFITQVTPQGKNSNPNSNIPNNKPNSKTKAKIIQVPKTKTPKMNPSHK